MSRTILVLGAQRSGTTWLGKIFDSHPDVIYRHEPDHAYPAPAEAVEPHLCGTIWDWIRLGDLRSAGKRPIFRKSWQSATAYLLRDLLNLLMTPVARLPVIGMRIDRAQLWGVRPDRCGQNARAVLKSITWCDGAGILARTLPESRTILILRHPCGQIASVMRGARARRFQLRDAGKHSLPFDFDKARAFAIARGVPADSFMELPVAAKFAWSWLAFNETAIGSLTGLPNAMTVLYEDLCEKPAAMTKMIFDFAGLSLGPETEAFLVRSTSHSGMTRYYSVLRKSAAVAGRWRTTMPDEDREAVCRVVRRSPLARYWPDLRTEAECDVASGSSAEPRRLNAG